MLFHSVSFFIFFPVVLLLYYLVPEKLKHKHFNDGLLYMQKGIEAYALEKKAREQKDAT